MKIFNILIIFILFFTYNTANAKPAQITDTVIMISPDYFQFNNQTAATNAFQHQTNNATVVEKALLEFNGMVNALRLHNIHVITLASRSDAITPDAVFPNNWFSIHQIENGKSALVLYPMLVANRRLERQTLALNNVLKKNNILINKTIDFTYYEHENKALEGTGSLVLDRENKIAYASISPRTNLEALKDFSSKLGYKSIVFKSYDEENKLIYHTNVMMSIGNYFALVCEECIKNKIERRTVLTALKNSHKEIIVISQKQVTHMAGNILQVSSKGRKIKIILSRNAYEVLSKIQKNKLSNFGKFVIVDIPIIEKIGGGSARCMVAEVFYS